MFELMDGHSETAIIKVVGIGGGGGNAVGHMIIRKSVGRLPWRTGTAFRR
jgi:cell division protein FtsZ